ncbi:MAG: hypothetical protein JST00_01445 [Deltaproteobacteria bacterium]|nr:hypothetical protein [Deltaproteobacteria bacterium]
MSEWSARFWFSLLAAIGTLSLAATALVAGRRSALSRPLAIFCFSLFGWNFATLGRHVLGGDAPTVLDAIFTALSPPCLLEFVLAFVGEGRRWRRARIGAWVLFGGLALASTPGFGSKPVVAFIDGPVWPAVFLVGWIPSSVLSGWVLVKHLVRTSDAREKARTRTVLVALAIGVSTSTSDIAHGLGLPTPYIAAIGTLVVAALLTTLVVRFGLFDRNVSLRTAIYVIGMIGALVTLELVVFRMFAGSLPAQSLGTAIVLLVVLAVARELGLALAEARDRVQRLAVVGRFSAQMAHDVRGPLTALLGAAQVLEGEKDEKKREPLLRLAVEQARRISAIVDRYDRMGRVEPRKTLVRVNEVARSVARSHQLSGDALALDGSDPEVEADRDLLESALENVVRNAVEATKEIGAVRIETTRAGRSIVVRVVDTGAGMDARQRERAFEDFFTTKEGGSGLGLSFARRVLVAHGGDAQLESELGRGTTIELVLPLDGAS